MSLFSSIGDIFSDATDFVSGAVGGVVGGILGGGGGDTQTVVNQESSQAQDINFSPTTEIKNDTTITNQVDLRPVAQAMTALGQGLTLAMDNASIRDENAAKITAGAIQANTRTMADVLQTNTAGITAALQAGNTAMAEAIKETASLNLAGAVIQAKAEQERQDKEQELQKSILYQAGEAIKKNGGIALGVVTLAYLLKERKK